MLTHSRLQERRDVSSDVQSERKDPTNLSHFKSRVTIVSLVHSREGPLLEEGVQVLLSAPLVVVGSWRAAYVLIPLQDADHIVVAKVRRFIHRRVPPPGKTVEKWPPGRRLCTAYKVDSGSKVMSLRWLMRWCSWSNSYLLFPKGAGPFVINYELYKQ